MTDTFRSLDEAIQAHIAEVFPGHITDRWILVTHSTHLDENGIHNYRMVSGAGQGWDVDAGLVSAGHRIVRDAWDYDGEDDE